MQVGSVRIDKAQHKNFHSANPSSNIPVRALVHRKIGRISGSKSSEGYSKADFANFPVSIVAQKPESRHRMLAKIRFPAPIVVGLTLARSRPALFAMAFWRPFLGPVDDFFRGKAKSLCSWSRQSPRPDAKNHLLKGARNAVGLVVARLPRIRQRVAEWRLNNVRQMEYAIHIPVESTWGNPSHVILEVTPRKNRWVLSTADIIVVKTCYPVGIC